MLRQSSYGHVADAVVGTFDAKVSKQFLFINTGLMQ